jgi:hypothetical protein
MYAILMRMDPEGECPVVVRVGETLLTSPGVLWRFVAEVDDEREAYAIVLELQRARDFTPAAHRPSLGRE